MTGNNKLAVGCALIATLSGCGGGSHDAPAEATLSLALTDAPIDEVFAVNVQLTGVSIKPQVGAALDFDFPAPVDVDLLSLHDGNVFMLLNGEVVDAGQYNWIELKANADLDGVVDSYVMETDTGGQMELRIPSSSLRLVSRFVVTAGQMNSFTLDWDVRKGLTDPVGQAGWFLTPAFRLIDMTQYGSLSGTVADALVMDASCTSDAEGSGDVVYIYNGFDTVPDDLGSVGEPVTTAPVRIDNAMAGAYTYTVLFLDPGQYTVAFTCQGLDDNSAVDEMGINEIVFAGQVNAEVAMGQGTTNDAPSIE